MIQQVEHALRLGAPAPGDQPPISVARSPRGWRRPTRALHECTLAIPEGHIAALVGRNGAGKSTLLNLTVGLATLSEGEVTVLGGFEAGSLCALDEIGIRSSKRPARCPAVSRYSSLPERGFVTACTVPLEGTNEHALSSSISGGDPGLTPRYLT